MTDSEERTGWAVFYAPRPKDEHPVYEGQFPTTVDLRTEDKVPLDTPVVPMTAVFKRHEDAEIPARLCGRVVWPVKIRAQKIEERSIVLLDQGHHREVVTLIGEEMIALRQ